MANDTKQIKILINAEVKKAINDFKKLEAQKKKNKKEVGELGKAFKTMAGTLAVAFSGQQLASFATQSVQVSAKIRTMERSFHSLGKSIGTNDKSLDKLRGALNGTMTDTELMEQANNAMLLGIVDSDDQMAELFDNAQRLAQALGRDARYGVESLTTGIGRQSRLMLDNLGIIVKAEDAYKAYAKELGKNTSQLTENERKQAFISATMESVRQKVAELGPEVLDLNQLFDANSVATENLQKELGNKLEPMFKKMTLRSIEIKDAIAEFIKGISGETIEKIKGLGKTIAITASIFAGYRTIAILTKNANVLLATSFNVIKKASGFLAVASLVELARNNFDKIKREFFEFLLFVEENRPNFFKSDEEEKARIQELKDRIAEINKAITAPGGEGEDVSFGVFGDLYKLLVEDGSVAVDNAKAIGDGIKAGAEGYDESEETSAELSDHQQSILKAQTSTTEQIFKSVRAQKDVANSVVKILANFVLQIVKLKIMERIEKKITAEKKKQVALSAVAGTFSPFATGGSFVNNTPRYETGGSFVTNSRTILPTNPPAIVGDNSSARELIEITPLPNPTKQGRQITININAPVVDEYVVDSIIPAIRRAEKLGL
jgi:hypothetical protein